MSVFSDYQTHCRKIHRGLEAFEENTDTSSAYSSASQLKRSIKRGNSVPLTDYENVLWYGTITVGTPAVNFTGKSPLTRHWQIIVARLTEQHSVQFDTGSGDLVIPGANCDSTCDGHTLYNSSASSTSSDFNQTFEIQSGSGNHSSTVTGEQYTDIVTLAGYKVSSHCTEYILLSFIDICQATRQRLGAADNYPADGLLGMGYESISRYGASPVFQTLVSQGQVSTPEFGFYLAESGSELYIGGTNPNHYTGPFTYTPVTKQVKIHGTVVPSI